MSPRVIMPGKSTVITAPKAQTHSSNCHEPEEVMALMYVYVDEALKVIYRQAVGCLNVCVLRTRWQRKTQAQWRAKASW